MLNSTTLTKHDALDFVLRFCMGHPGMFPKIPTTMRGLVVRCLVASLVLLSSPVMGRIAMAVDLGYIIEGWFEPCLWSGIIPISYG